MVKAFTTNTRRYVALFEEVVQEMMPPSSIDVEGDDVSSF
jgi:hypothetical protein